MLTPGSRKVRSLFFQIVQIKSSKMRVSSKPPCTLHSHEQYKAGTTYSRGFHNAKVKVGQNKSQIVPRSWEDIDGTARIDGL